MHFFRIRAVAMRGTSTTGGTADAGLRGAGAVCRMLLCSLMININKLLVQDGLAGEAAAEAAEARTATRMAEM